MEMLLVWCSLYDFRWQLLMHVIFSRLSKCVRENPQGEVIFSDLSKRCHYNKQTLAMLLKRLFPKTTSVKRSLHGIRDTVIHGIEIIQKEDIMVDQVNTTLSELKNCIPPDVLLMQSDSEEKLTLNIASNLSSNGNTVLKTLKLSTTDWELWVRGCKVNLRKLNIDNTFNVSKEYLNTILDITRKLSLCEGCPYEKAVRPENHTYLKEKLQDSEGEPRYVFRSKSCKQALPWMATGKVCATCRGIGEHRKSQEEVPEDSHQEMTLLLEKCFPCAPDDMMILLKAQQDALQAKCVTGRRWNKHVLSTCQSLRLRSPLGYEYLRRSGMLILPSRRHLSRYKEIVVQDIPKWSEIRDMGKLKGKVKKSKGVKRKRGKRKMNKKKGKGKGKGKKLKRVQWPCGGCRNECSMDCVCCDSCSIWFHYQCLGLYGDEAELEEEEWFCPGCKSKKADGDVACMV
ncbi:hypothetical protein HOLleu_33992 [Holothuria leucospilota]|uniref:PHD-type domain-containing protein n=1 Tax=Holothuria leucospilota TaxID=206669 RepID=A0A9Q1BHJ0_HOLLE|nr:hypothetical protein HOLleu_33992 [Holothuria leucospilota]